MSGLNTKPAEGVSTRLPNSDKEHQDTELVRGAEISLKIGYKPFLSDFDPEKSEREKRKLNQRLYGYRNKGRTLYDEKGIYVPTGENLCDCLQPACSGCHFPCSKCKSRKCGHECRTNRKWTYQSIACEGMSVVDQNPHFHE